MTSIHIHIRTPKLITMDIGGSIVNPEYGNTQTSPSAPIRQNSTGPGVPHPEQPSVPAPIAPRLNALQPVVIRKIQMTDFSSLTSALKPLDLQKKNWSTWSRSMTRVLNFVKAKGYIEGMIPRLNPDIDPDIADNRDYNDMFLQIVKVQGP
jgi:hypothetical protein